MTTAVRRSTSLEDHGSALSTDAASWGWLLAVLLLVASAIGFGVVSAAQHPASDDVPPELSIAG